MGTPRWVCGNGHQFDFAWELDYGQAPGIPSHCTYCGDSSYLDPVNSEGNRAVAEWNAELRRAKPINIVRKDGQHIYHPPYTWSENVVLRSESTDLVLYEQNTTKLSKEPVARVTIPVRQLPLVCQMLQTAIEDTESGEERRTFTHHHQPAAYYVHSISGKSVFLQGEGSIVQQPWHRKIDMQWSLVHGVLHDLQQLAKVLPATFVHVDEALSWLEAPTEIEAGGMPDLFARRR